MKPLFVLLVFLLAPAYRAAAPHYAWHFPADDGAHPAYANEWWYFTGNLAGSGGHRYGFELTFFRISPAPGTALDHQLFFTHFAISDLSGRTYFAHERARRGDWRQAGVQLLPAGLRLWNENWQADFDASGPVRLQASWGGHALDLRLRAGARRLNGVGGYSQKGSLPGQASEYYSFPHIEVRGTVNQAAVTGLAWMDHEFASNQLAADQQGWDWMGLHLPGDDLMLFNLRDTNGARDPHSAGTLMPAAGTPQPLAAADFTMTPRRWWQGYPVSWRVIVPSRQLDVTVSAALDDQEFHAPASGVRYWEGAVTVSGRCGGKSCSGEGYLELTGYGLRFDLLGDSPAAHEPRERVGMPPRSRGRLKPIRFDRGGNAKAARLDNTQRSH
ncbi:MAG TPA: lipocalin-like domain-containing protein [Terriglobales bacterium]|nr:lipocalin-like domain-containing protein [Terriglobales bacterium]